MYAADKNIECAVFISQAMCAAGKKRNTRTTVVPSCILDTDSRCWFYWRKYHTFPTERPANGFLNWSRSSSDEESRSRKNLLNYLHTIQYITSHERKKEWTHTVTLVQQTLLVIRGAIPRNLCLLKYKERQTDKAQQFIYSLLNRPELHHHVNTLLLCLPNSTPQQMHTHVCHLYSEYT